MEYFFYIELYFLLLSQDDILVAGALRLKLSRYYYTLRCEAHFVDRTNYKSVLKTYFDFHYEESKYKH